VLISPLKARKVYTYVHTVSHRTWKPIIGNRKTNLECQTERGLKAPILVRMQEAFHIQGQVLTGGFDPRTVLMAYCLAGCMLRKSSITIPKALIKTAEISNYRSFETVFPFNAWIDPVNYPFHYVHT
jgi:hypothetical protein